MNHRESTQVRFGKVTAYAKRRMRTVSLSCGRITLSLQELCDVRSPSSPLLLLKEGDTLCIDMMDRIVPSLGSVAWTFSQSTPQICNLTTIADNIEVTLAMPAADSDSAFEIEGILRGTAARIVVATGYVSQHFE